MGYQSLHLSDIKRWSKYFEKLPSNQQDIYYTPEYYQLYELLGDGKAECFVFEEKDDVVIYPFLKNSINNLGFNLNDEFFDIQGSYGYNGIITSSYKKEFIKKFYLSFTQFCNQNNIIAEFTRFNPLLQNQVFSEGYLDIFLDRQVYFINLLQSEDEIWQNYSSVNRNMIRKAFKNNVTIEVSQSVKDYDKFMQIYHVNMDRVNADPYYYFDQNYFRKLANEFDGNSKLILAKLNSEILGGMILFIKGDYAHYHLSAQTIDGRKLAVNNLYLHEAIKVAKAFGCKKMHFGGGTSNNPKDPLLRFKSNFSKTYSTFYFGTKTYNQEIYNLVCKQWSELFPHKVKKFNKFFLKYHN